MSRDIESSIMGRRWTTFDFNESAEKKEKEVGREPFEVLANKPLPNLKLICSTPVCREWDNGNLVSHVRALFSQHLASGVAIESNYILNTGNAETYEYDESVGSKLFNVRREKQLASDFIKKIVEVQRLALSKTNSEDQESLRQIIENEPDILVRDVLSMAKDRAHQVAISAVCVDSLDQLRGQGYNMGIYIADVRSVGFDFAYKRLSDDGVFLMDDADTLPSNNRFATDILKVYQDYPEISYLFLGMGYLPAGESRGMVANSIYESSRRAASYNFNLNGSPQISFRRRVMETLRGILVAEQVYEDYQTAHRLRNFFGEIQNGILNSKGIFIPTQMTSERMTGFVDGLGRQVNAVMGIKLFEAAIPNAVKLYESDDEIIKKGFGRVSVEEVDKVRRYYHRQQKMLLNFNRKVVAAFLHNLELGNIVIADGNVKVDEAAVFDAGRNLFARPLLTYLRANMQFIASLTEEDIGLMKYYLFDQKFPETIVELSFFQKAMREYIGYYPDGEKFLFTEIAKLDSERSIFDKTALYQPFIAEVLAHGAARSTNYDAVVLKDNKDRVRIGEELPKRAAWVDLAFSTSDKVDPDSDEDHLNIDPRALELLPFGELVLWLLSKK